MRCYDESTLKKLAVLNPCRQHSLIERMATKPGAGISQQDVEALQRGFQSIQGF
jgi:hypothetical protein